MRMCGVLLILCLGQSGQAQQKNLVLISIDTLRQDHVGCYGGDHSLTPAIDRLAQDSVLFENAYCHTPLTSPSMCSVMTSQYPHSHGSIRNGMKMMGDPVTLAEVLREQGYDTEAFISNWTLKARLTKLNSGFDFYDDEFQSKRWGKVFKGESTAEEINARVLPRLTMLKEPFFLWVHYSDPHAPYHLHEEFLPTDVPVAERDSPQVRYDTEVAYADRYVGELLDRLKGLALSHPLTLMLIADHGESLGEHDYYGHGRQIFQPMMRIPFLIQDEGFPAGQRVNALAGLIDLAPTALDLLGFQVPGGMKGSSLRPGLPVADKIYMETYPGAVPNVPIYKQTRRHRMPSHIGVVQSSWKAIYETESEKIALFNVDKDPGELFDAAATRSAGTLEEMRKMCLSWYESAKPIEEYDEQEEELTREDIKALKSLGYLE